MTKTGKSCYIQTVLSTNLIAIPELQLPINHQIRVPQVYLIDEAGDICGVIDTRVAQQMADSKELDLVLVSPQANPPVAKIIDYGKYKYEQERKGRKNKAKKSQEIKEIRLSYNTDDHDFEIKLNQARKFVKEGHKIKLRLKLVGREMAFKPKAIEQLDRFRDMIEMEYEQPLQFQGKQITVLLKEKK